MSTARTSKTFPRYPGEVAGTGKPKLRRKFDHMAIIKAMPCAVCGESAPSDAHHILEGRTPGRKSPDQLAIPLCKSCHQDSRNGIHGDQAMWRVMRKTELICLAETIETLLGGKE